MEAGEEEITDGSEEALAGQVEQVSEYVAAEPPLAPERVEAILSRVRARQAEVGYPGDYATWIEKVSP